MDLEGKDDPFNITQGIYSVKVSIEIPNRLLCGIKHRISNYKSQIHYLWYLNVFEPYSLDIYVISLPSVFPCLYRYLSLRIYTETIWVFGLQIFVNTWSGYKSTMFRSNDMSNTYV